MATWNPNNEIVVKQADWDALQAKANASGNASALQKQVADLMDANHSLADGHQKMVDERDAAMKQATELQSEIAAIKAAMK